MQSEYHEEDLIRAAQKGDRDAFARLYEAHAERVYRYLVRRLGQPADAEDVTAEVFVRAMRALPSYKAKGFIIYAGKGPLSEKTFQVANMGVLTTEDIYKFLEAFEASLMTFGFGFQ